METPVGSKQKVLTFRQAYTNNLNDQVRFKKQIPEETLNIDFSGEGIGNDLKKFIEILEQDSKLALPRLRNIIKNVSGQKMPMLEFWRDPKGYDILQHCIMNNRPDIIHYLLGDVKLFQKYHQPRFSPYAHMAATIGFKECLEAVLTHRRGDFFVTSEPQHAIILPTALTQRLKLNLSSGMADKQLNSLMKNIKEDTAIAETALWNTKRSIFHEDNITKVKSSFTEKPEKPRRGFYSTALHASSSSEKPEVILQQPLGTKRVPVDKPQTMKSTGKKPVKSKITVHWDVFKDEVEGVVGGAGVPVEVVHAKYKDTTKLQADLPNATLERKNVMELKKPTLPRIKSSKKPGPKAHHLSSMSLNQHPSSMLDQQLKRPVVSATGNHAGTSVDSVQKKHSKKSRIEFGIRQIKKYKKFKPVVEHRTLQIEPPRKHMGKTPLTMAAEKGHIECVKYLLVAFYEGQHSATDPKDPLTLATKAKSPESIAVLLENKISLSDYQSAILLSLRELYPDCLTILLTLGSKTSDRNRKQIFGGTNLFHVLYSQSLIANYRYEMLPEMTRVLINCKEDVNAHNPAGTFPLYTLIKCAFNVLIGEKISYYLTCLKMLLNASADPNYNEMKNRGRGVGSLDLSRPSYRSAIQCVFVNAHKSLGFFEQSHWSQIIMQKFIDTIVANDKTPRKVNNDILFVYMQLVDQLGLNRRVLRTLLRYGANPDFNDEGQFPLNTFFEYTIPFLTRFQVTQKYSNYDDLLTTLLILCRAMSADCLQSAIIQFLDRHLLSTPIQALELTRKFCYYANQMMTSPRTLSHLTSNYLWSYLGRNANKVHLLPVRNDLIQTILP